MEQPNVTCFYYTAFWCKSYVKLMPFLDFLKQKHASWCNIQEISIDRYPERATMDHIVEIPCFVFYNKGNRLDTVTCVDTTKIETIFLSIRNSLYNDLFNTSDATVSPSTESEDILKV
jgi:hypothetical protein